MKGTALRQIKTGQASGEDAYPILDYVKSRDALITTTPSVDIIKNFSQKGDFVDRYHHSWDDTFESRWRYYKRKIVEVDYKSDSSIITLKTFAYDAKTAYKINDSLLGAREELVNAMNQRAAKDSESLALKEVHLAERDAISAARQLATYRIEKSVFDPSRQSALQFQQANGLQAKLFAIETQRSQLMVLAPNNPQIAALDDAGQRLRSQIDVVNAQISGGNQSMASKGAD